MTPEQTVQLINLLKAKRSELQLSVNEVARRANVDPGTVWRIEQGMIAQPRAESLIAIGKVLEVNAMDLFITAGWLTASDLPSLSAYLGAKFAHLPRPVIDDVERYVAQAVDSHDRLAGNHAAAHSELCHRAANHCPQCPCAPKEC